MSNKHNKYAVIGAGISGSSLAFHLQQYGNQVDIFDKGRTLGGRLSTYQKDHQTFDYGSTLINTYPEPFLSILHQWEKLNLVSPYQGIIKIKSKQQEDSTLLDKANFYISHHGMSAIVKHLLKEVRTFTSTRITSVKKEIDGWWLKGTYYEQQIKKEGYWGPYKYVICTLPGPQAAPLLLSHRLDWGTSALKTKYLPQWSITFQFCQKQALPFDLMFYHESHPLKLMSKESFKYSQASEIWTLQTQAKWSANHIESTKEEIAELVMNVFKKEHHISDSPISTHVHRWRYSYPSAPCQELNSLIDKSLGLGVCGDWITGGTIGAAYLGAKNLADDCQLAWG